MHALVLSGVKQAAFINVVTTAAKIAPLVAFVLIAIFAFNYDKFTLNFWGGGASGASLGAIAHQVRSTMIVTLWVFIGIEGASVYSSYAAKRSDVGKATLIGFAGALDDLRARLAALDRNPGPEGAGRPARALDGRRAGASRRALGRGA